MCCHTSLTAARSLAHRLCALVSCCSLHTQSCWPLALQDAAGLVHQLRTALADWAAVEEEAGALVRSVEASVARVEAEVGLDGRTVAAHTARLTACRTGVLSSCIQAAAGQLQAAGCSAAVPLLISNPSLACLCLAGGSTCKEIQAIGTTLQRRFWQGTDTCCCAPLPTVLQYDREMAAFTAQKARRGERAGAALPAGMHRR